MWRIYSPEKNGVRVATTVRKLFGNFYDSTDHLASLKYLIGSVKYVGRQEIENFLANTTLRCFASGGQPHGFAKTLLMKREAFSHENEIRLLFQDAEGKFRGKDVAMFPFPWETVITGVALDPRWSESEFRTEQQKLTDLGCTFPIIQSDLYKFSPTVIRLG